ncbi:uncharacterized protein TNCV_2038471 [Trichonephila clavipes]|nr:uncharacterized protein TNCV_2038471 [Trichonephila clavipes]
MAIQPEMEQEVLGQTFSVISTLSGSLTNILTSKDQTIFLHCIYPSKSNVVAVAEWYRYRIVACLVTSSSPVPLNTRRVGQRCTLNLSRDETSSRWCGSGVVHVT